MALQSKRHTAIFLCNLIVLIMVPQSSFAQFFKDTLVLKEITIVSNRLQNFSTGSKIQVVDSASLIRYSSLNLSDLLSNESSLFIKSYGLGGMATSSFRGAGASQTITLWNGFNLNSPMNGQLDLALIPINFSSKVSIQHGGAGALWGSGAMGGAIHIQQQAFFNRGITVGANFSAGSFQNISQQYFVECSKRRWVSAIKIFSNSAKNDFEFHNTFLQGNPLQRQTNAERKSSGLLLENAIKFKNNQQLNFVFWYQMNDRNIPPTMLQGTVNDNQKDENYRLSAEYQYQKGNKHFFLRSAYFDERFNYNGLHSRSQTNIAEAELKWRVKNHLLNIGFNNTYTQAEAANYSGFPHQNRTAIFASFKMNSRTSKSALAISARQEMLDAQFIPFTYSAGAEIKIKPWCLFKMNASKLFRVPTLNDLYWNPGGNIALKSEEGYSEDASLKFCWKSKSKVTEICFEPGVFNRNTNNQIIWLPSGSFWTPQNLVKVWSRGVETVSNIKIEKASWKFKILVITNYVLATNQQSKTEGDASVGKQLIYTPRYSGCAKISAEYKGFYFAFSHTYTGYRYTATDNSQFISPFDVANVYLSKNFKYKKANYSAFISVENIFNEEYQVVLSRAMPMRYYAFGMTLTFNYLNKSQKNEN